MESSSRVSTFYTNCNILLTGGTGFLAKLLIQKLLRTCPDIGDIYLIIRQKGKGPETRLEDILSNVVIDEMKNTVPNYREKIHVVLGDIQYSDMGLHQDDRRMLIEQIIHCGASLNFTESLKTSVYTNVRGTRDTLALAEEVKNWKCMMYVSSAYSNCNHLTIQECFYKPPILPDTLIKIVDEMDDEVLEKVTPAMIGGWPNTYSYTKAVAEQLIKNKMDDLPVGVLRQSMIFPTYNDPLCCWTDNLCGYVGVIVGGLAGVYHVVHGDWEIRYDNIPADIVINTLIASIPDVAKQLIVRLYKNIHKYAEAVSYFAAREFNIANDNVVRLWNKQNDVDKQIYSLNMADLDWEDYLKHFCFGIKKYLIKGKMDDESIQKAINKERKLKLVHRIVQVLLLVGCLYIIWIVFNQI